MSFSQYATDWWIWDRCPYVKKKIARGATISRGYCDINRRNLERYIIPFFGKIKLSKIAPGLIEDFLMGLKEPLEETNTVLSHKTINNILTTIRVMLREAHRLGYIPTTELR